MKKTEEDDGDAEDRSRAKEKGQAWNLSIEQARQVIGRWQRQSRHGSLGAKTLRRGDRDPALATDPNLDYQDAVELQLLWRG